MAARIRTPRKQTARSCRSTATLRATANELAGTSHRPDARGHPQIGRSREQRDAVGRGILLGVSGRSGAQASHRHSRATADCARVRWISRASDHAARQLLRRVSQASQCDEEQHGKTVGVAADLCARLQRLCPARRTNLGPARTKLGYRIRFVAHSVPCFRPTRNCRSTERSAPFGSGRQGQDAQPGRRTAHRGMVCRRRPRRVSRTARRRRPRGRGATLGSWRYRRASTLIRPRTRPRHRSCSRCSARREPGRLEGTAYVVQRLWHRVASAAAAVAGPKGLLGSITESDRQSERRGPLPKQSPPLPETRRARQAQPASPRTARAPRPPWRRTECAPCNRRHRK